MMMNRLVTVVLPLTLLGACLDTEATSETDQAVSGENGLHGAPEPAAHEFNAKGNARPGGGGGSPLMTLHGGNVLDGGSKTKAIFWGSEWSTASFAGDKITGLDTFFTGFGGTNFAGTSGEYYGANGQYVTRASTYLGHVIDSSAAPSKALSVNGAIAEACKIANQLPDPAAVYFIYTSTGAGHVSYCAWHSWGTCSNNLPIQVAYMPNIDGIAGCDPVDDYNTGHSQGLTAVANVTSHELHEAITDPRGTGWTDSSGAENGDKCAWTFTGAVTLGGQKWKLQQEWSNAAYTAGTGNANRSGQKGCIQGQ